MGWAGHGGVARVPLLSDRLGGPASFPPCAPLSGSPIIPPTFPAHPSLGEPHPPPRTLRSPPQGTRKPDRELITPGPAPYTRNRILTNTFLRKLF